ncbi:hypothetical protein [Blastococcus brunescens]|uniref:Uncharacterized protein n=1 Tax=Blastococcus brunescens TaxID=1564165 RepID=A0ABZ1BB06_9ACTN|nr:hypothetical protein [Blastococcus sp. BMG 8361]WRL67343.1 hypothetical protein U6N30_04375 [Blastococcus sp. BMG 8361]
MRGRTDRSGRTGLRLAAFAVAAACVLSSTPAGAAPADAWSSETAGGANASTNPGESVITAANAARARVAWTVDGNGGPLVAPTVVGGQVFRVRDTGSAGPASTFEVRSARTGAVAWTLALPGNAFYEQGVTVDAARSSPSCRSRGSAVRTASWPSTSPPGGSPGPATCPRAATAGRATTSTAPVRWSPTEPGSSSPVPTTP